MCDFNTTDNIAAFFNLKLNTFNTSVFIRNSFICENQTTSFFLNSAFFNTPPNIRIMNTES